MMRAWRVLDDQRAADDCAYCTHSAGQSDGSLYCNNHKAPAHAVCGDYEREPGADDA